MLKRIAGVNQIDISSLILGLKINSKFKQTSFNWVVQHAHFAIWKSRCMLNFDQNNEEPVIIFKTNIFRSLCRIKTVLKRDMFFRYFEQIAEPSNSTIGFRVKM